jgi:hypothetical protein
LMHQAIIHLPPEIPEPDFAVHAGFLLVMSQLPVGRPGPVGGRQRFIVLDFDAVDEVVETVSEFILVSRFENRFTIRFQTDQARRK